MSEASDDSRAEDVLRPADARARPIAELLPLVYDELRRLADQHMACEPPGQTLQPTALVHEVYLRLAGQLGSDWQNRAHFFAAAAEAMRRILVERARRHGRLKRGGGRERVPLVDVPDPPAEVDVDLVALDEALGRLETLDPRKAQIVNLRYFAGRTIEETAEVLGVSAATVKSEWKYAKAWLHRELTAGCV